VKKVKDGACPRCGSRQFVGKRTAKGLVAGGILFAPQRLKCASCGLTLKSGSDRPTPPRAAATSMAPVYERDSRPDPRGKPPDPELEQLRREVLRPRWWEQNESGK
jgi:DNA-directed RNA polymerase subunit RPC12/RpoP